MVWPFVLVGLSLIAMGVSQSLWTTAMREQQAEVVRSSSNSRCDARLPLTRTDAPVASDEPAVAIRPDVAPRVVPAAPGDSEADTKTR